MTTASTSTLPPTLTSPSTPRNSTNAPPTSSPISSSPPLANDGNSFTCLLYTLLDPWAHSDEKQKSRGFAVQWGAEELELEELNMVFVAVGFPRWDPERICVALEHMEVVVWVESERRGGQWR
ncbi:hypothetical protein Fmac_026420 [Flemingia macrophylla]|uniref:Uncharacterized protein n=1 Tax=Flemingia macrophylla TaxID=520843 RepID=A0ABD1LEZ2_9FABA